MLESYLIRGILIGLIFGLPFGAVGTMTVQRTFRYGLKEGLITGLGSSIADCFYACVGAFGLTLISDFLLRYQTLINLVGGSLIMALGIRLFFRKDSVTQAQNQATNRAGMFLSSFIIGITNPAAILTFLFAFSYFGIAGTTNLFEGTALVAGVFIGTYIWWTSLSAVVSIVKKKTSNFNFQYMNRIFGIILSMFGAAVFIRIILEKITEMTG